MKFILEVEVAPDTTFESLARTLRDQATKLPEHPLPRDRPTIGDGGGVFLPDGRIPVRWYIED